LLAWVLVLSLGICPMISCRVSLLESVSVSSEEESDDDEDERSTVGCD
jgi:hypothetical protein